MSGIPESQKSESAPSASQLTLTKRERLTQGRVRELFDYTKDGLLVRKVGINNTKIGDIVGSPSGKGHLLVMVDKRLHKVHRIVWLWHHGYLPEYGIDHINRIGTDNRIENLREAGQQCNQRNTGNYRNNTSGVKGVSWQNNSQKYRAEIKSTDRRLYLGQSEDFLEAVCHRLAAEQALDWAGCDDCSPAFQYVKQHINHIR